jgi:hypothetical protein
MMTPMINLGGSAKSGLMVWAEVITGGPPPTTT